MNRGCAACELSHVAHHRISLPHWRN